ncbi:type VII toxin-antitoxin system HepT family RNase toxin [Catenovulum sediminis]|uniref:DUF86 domain-containing protein n=1 Tax=Catenovulum sediminis TaxID=1740262 RepID=A0ABV1RJU8_9ALTE
MLEAYARSIQEHIRENHQDLVELENVLNSRSWTRIERKAAERVLQILVESCIGISKHWLKLNKINVPSDTYQVFVKVCELGAISQDELVVWRKIVGMRNAIVHDYLNLEPAILVAIIKQQLYLDVVNYGLKMSERLCGSCRSSL